MGHLTMQSVSGSVITHVCQLKADMGHRQLGGFGCGPPAMQEREMIALFLIGLFLSGVFEALVLKRKDLACSTWLLELLILVGGVVYPLTTIRIVGGAVIFVFGVVLIVAYYRHRTSSL
jgi:hypothetical protein